MSAPRLLPRLLRATRSLTTGPSRPPRPPPPSNPAHVITARVTRVTPSPPVINSLGEGAAGNIGDIQDPHTHDPLKWRKAAWKYVGAVVVFGAFYKGLHWYVGKVAEEGRAKRADMEVSKTEVFETAADRERRRIEDQKTATEMLEKAQRPLGEVGETGVGKGEGDAVEDEKDRNFELFKSVKDGEGYVSPEQELRVYETELEGKLAALMEIRAPSVEEREEISAVQQEVYDVQAELKDFESKKK